MNTQSLSAYRTEDGTICLGNAPGKFRPIPGALEGLPTEIAGQPVTYMWKDLIHVGKFRHPSEEFEVDVDMARIDRWVNTFGQMNKNGVRVFIPDDHSKKAKDNNGYVIRAQRNGETLEGLCQFIGEDAARKAARNEVSIGIAPSLKDGEGNVYEDAIEHVALTPVPVVNNQDAFVKAASRAAANDGSSKPAETIQDRSQNMAKSISCSEEHLSTLRNLIPGLKDAPDEEIVPRLVQHHQTMAHRHELYAGGPSAVATLSREQIEAKADERIAAAIKAQDEQVPALLAQNGDLRNQVTELSRKVVKALDPEAESAIVESAETKAERAVAEGGMDPACRDALLSLLVGPKGSRNALGLSRAANPKGDKALALAVLDILKENRPRRLGDLTDVQTLSRSVPGDNKTVAEKEAERAKEMLTKHLSAANPKE